MTNLEALLALHQIQTWGRLPVAADGRLYGPSYFSKRDWLPTLARKNRKVAFRLARLTTCVVCSRTLPANSTGDHIIPLADGGPDSADNFCPLCPSCNSSKGKNDLFAWLAAKGISPITLPLDVICAYVRLKYQALCDRGQLHLDAPASLVWAVQSFERTIPQRHYQTILPVSRAQARQPMTV